MLLRKYQEVAVDAASLALDDKGNTLVVAPTGAGKTIMLSALIGKRFKKGEQVLVLQHRDELVSQNSTKFHRVNKNITTSEVNASGKDWSADTVFAMVQTLSREKNLDQMPKLDLIVVDEAHHTAADTYQRIINAAREANEGVKIVGFTATPNRGDKAGLRGVFNNCSHQIEISTLIDEGFLVRPKTFVIDVGVQGELREVRKTIADFDMEAVEKIMNRRAVNVKVVEEWQRRCIGRKTIAFCSTIKHATDLCEEFQIAGVNAKIVTGDTHKNEREKILYELVNGDVEIVVNVAVLTEGFDAPPVSCIILTRPCSYKSTMVQMIGRGLRTIDPEEYPGVVKTDCTVLDFGTSILSHGSLDDPVNLDGGQVDSESGPVKICPECGSEVPLAVKECPICSHEFSSEGSVDAEELEHFELTEVDLMDRSPFRWIDLFGNGACMSASGFHCFSMVAEVNGLSIALVKKTTREHYNVRLISVGTRSQAMAAADDFMRTNEDSNSAKKTKRWLDERITDKQRNALNRHGITISTFDFGWTKYRAACMLNYVWNKQATDKMVYDVVERESA